MEDDTKPPDEITNPLKLWFLSQPKTITQTEIARSLGITRSHMSGLLKEKPSMPSLTLAAKIEEMTEGAVPVEWFVANGVQNLKRTA